VLIGVFINYLSANWAQTVTTLIATEIAIIVNFIINNLWTFKDFQLKRAEIPKQFAKFNVGALGSIAIQAIINNVGVLLFGLTTLMTIFGIAISSGLIYQVVGIAVGMFVNFFIYNRFIWRTKK
jgi:dolichol-phosphate mannosyltransferase